MLDLLLKSFTEKGSHIEAINVLKKCIEDTTFHIGLILGKYFCTLFPSNIDVLFETAICAHGANDRVLCFDLCEKLLSFGNLVPKDVETILSRQNTCIPAVADRYINYNPDIVQQILNHSKKPFPQITLTMTSCKRYDLFEKTVNSFINCCTDLEKIDEWFCVDDNSSEEDRKKMKDKYPFFNFYMKTIQEKGHPQSMNIIRNHVQTPYIFHMEDDFKYFVKRPFISQCLDVLSQSSQIGQCLLNRNYAETAKDICIVGGIPKLSNAGLRYYIHEHCSTKKELENFYVKYGGRLNCSYWPHFSFRPSLSRTYIWKDIGEFNEKVSHFEMEYSFRYRDAGYVSAFLESIYCLHIGRLTSERHDAIKNAYSLNDEKQFSGKEEQLNQHEQQLDLNIKTYVLNLDRRPDRWNTFCKQTEPKCLKYERFSAVDGAKLVPTEQLQRIFDGNDYNMRHGMVGCAMSHIKLWIELINSSYDAFCIMEDDLTFVPDFKTKFLHIYKALPNNWDICYLGHHVWKQYRNDSFYDKNILPIIEKWNTPTSLKYSMGGTGGYLISKKGAERMLEFINKYGMTNGIDTVQQKAADVLDIYYCKPHLIYTDCCTPENKVDTDIQNDFKSLTIPVDKRLSEETKFYSQFGEIIQITNMEDVQKYEKNFNTMFYTGPNIPELLKKSIYPCYSLNYQVMIIVPKPSQEILSKRYFERLKKNGKFDITDAIIYKHSPEVVPFSGMTHVYEAIQSVTKQEKIYPFDTIDGSEIETLIFLTEMILHMDDEELDSFVKEFCDPKDNEVINQSNGKSTLKNNKFKIRMPHEELHTLLPIYTHRFKNLRNIIKSGQPIVLIHCTRWITSPVSLFYYFIDLLQKYNENIKILTINGIDKREKIDEKYSHYLSTAYVDFPEYLRVNDWPVEKIYYDQGTFRLAIRKPIQKFLQ